MPSTQNTTIPRPGAETPEPVTSIPGPSEESFTNTFGRLLPSANYLSTAYGKIAYYTYAPSSGPTTYPERVLFIHGVQTPALGLQPLASTLHTKFPSSTFVLCDLWGHGLSSTPLVPHAPSLFHWLIDSLLEHLDWDSCHLIGYSFGGSTAISYIASSDQRAKRITSTSLIAPAGLWRSDSMNENKLNSTDFSVAKEHVLELLEGGPLVVPQDWQERVAKGEIVAEKVREWQMEHHAGHTASVVAIVRDGGVFGLQDTYAAAAKTGVPVIAILGETDDVVYEKDLRAAGIDNVVVVQGAGHAVVRQKVSEVAKQIEGFWTGLQ
ncbi:alpha/beta-hydrolase [Aureobasidium sp. EXF-10728]|nr:alpha/beta-hydrolase [Aureobasidium sp. EXF-10728]